MNNYCKKGFTLVEILIVIAIFGIVGSAASVMFNETRNRVVLEDAQASVINALEQARSRALTGVRTTGTTGSDHGIYIDYTNNKIYSFEGNAWPGTGQEISLPPNVSIIYPTSNMEIIFNRLSGQTNGEKTITLKNNISEENIDVIVNEAGIIF